MNYETVEQARELAVSAMQANEGQDVLSLLDQALGQFPHDGPLLFLYASELAEQQRYEDALEQFSNAVFNAPQMHIARFQLALLASTMERGDLVEMHLPYLMELKDSHYLGYFANGLAAIFAGELDRAVGFIEGGIAANSENPSLNQDMQQMLQRIQDARNEATQATAAGNGAQQSDEPEQEEGSVSTITGSVLLDIYKNTH